MGSLDSALILLRFWYQCPRFGPEKTHLDPLQILDAAILDDIGDLFHVLYEVIELGDLLQSPAADGGGGDEGDPIEEK